MKRLVFLSFLIVLSLSLFAQQSSKLKAAMDEFNNDEQLRFATTGFYVIDGATGETVFDQNGQAGMATASTEKIITAATAFEVLGKDFTYATKFGIVKTAKGSSLYIQASGDPTLGSWRWEETKETVILDKLKAALKGKGITQLQSVIISTKDWSDDDVIPDGWIWQDLGQYYGAGAQGLNWRENQFDLLVKSGNNIGDKVSIIKTNPYLYNYKIVSQATAAGKETGDRTYLYYPSKGDNFGILKGTIPAGKDNFVISGSVYDPARQLANTIINEIKNSVTVKDEAIEITPKTYPVADWIYTHQSPPLSKIVYWFLRKSINLYGEALLKTVALKEKGTASTDKGIEAEQEYWKDKGIDVEELHLYDGSGLSPQNRITPHAQVTVLQYAKKQPWFNEFYEALPLYNDIKMKSGTINRVKGYTGYQQSKDGKAYIFSMLINNYNGSEYALIRKMYKVLDHLK
ncbi:MAG: D-alanyl-D-alanine carboxypeptidase/D-alanyl-D-alanine-endopeptidase [Niabella sp.]